MLRCWGKKAESEIMMSSMQRPVYEEGDDSAVELIKSLLGPRAFSEAGQASSGQRYGLALCAEGSDGCMCFRWRNASQSRFITWRNSATDNGAEQKDLSRINHWARRPSNMQREVPS